MTLKAGTFVFDANVLIAMMRGEGGLAARLRALEDAATCSVVEAELLYGALCSSRRERNEAAVQRVMGLLRIVPADSRIAAAWADLKNQLRVAGRMIPDNDIWIAACALAEGATLVTRDAHFQVVGGLAVEEW